MLFRSNHDPAVFADPHTLKLDRPNANRHQAFAGGIHYCLGASLARLEAEIAVGSLVARFPSMHAVGPITWRDRLTIRGVDRLALVGSKDRGLGRVHRESVRRRGAQGHRARPG